MKRTQPTEEIIQRFSDGMERLAKAVEGLSEDNLNLSMAPGEWSVRQIVHHLADDGDVWSMVMKKAIATPGVPVRFEGFPGNDAWANTLAFDQRGVQVALTQIKAHREAMSGLARHFISDLDNRYVVIVDQQDRELQKVTAGQVIAMLTEHMDEHLATIESIKRKHAL